MRLTLNAAAPTLNFTSMQPHHTPRRMNTIALVAAVLAVCVLSASAELHGHDMCGRICACHVLHAPYVKLATRADVAPPVFTAWRQHREVAVLAHSVDVPTVQSRAPPLAA